jgi:hypothetical protein
LPSGAFVPPSPGSPHALPNVPTDKGYIKIYSTHKAFAAIKANGSIASWGSLDNSWNEIKNKTTNAPTDKGYTEIYSNAYTFSMDMCWILWQVFQALDYN